jgi:hypothetical protein
VGFLCMARATGATSIGAGAELFLAAGGAFFRAVLAVVGGLIVRAREAT